MKPDFETKLAKMKDKAERRLQKQKEVQEQIVLRAKTRLEKVKAQKKQRSKKHLKDELWRITSRIVRYQSNICYSCEVYLPDFRLRNTGHFWSQGGHGAARYHWDNLRVQCVNCNNWKSGNLAEYGWRLLQEIGQQRFDDLRLLAKTTHAWGRLELEKMIEERKELLKKFES